MRHEQLVLFAIFLGANNFDRFSQRQPEKLQMIIVEMEPDGAQTNFSLRQKYRAFRFADHR